MARLAVSGQATIHAVAAKAGVSLMTVSRAIRGVDGVSAATRARVVKLAREMNYVPNSNAQALAVTNSRLIGISLPNLANDVFADVLAGMRRTFEQAGYSSVLDTTDYDPVLEQRWAERVLPWRPAALILTGSDHSDVLRARLTAEKVPTLEIWDATDNPIDISVGIDHFAAGMQLGQYAVNLGYRRPVFVGTPQGRDSCADARYDGIAQAFAKTGSSLGRISVTGTNAFVMGAQGASQVDPATLPDIAFFLSDHMAFGGMTAFQKAGLSAPEDIGIAGFNALDLNTVLPVPITTLSTPRRQIGLIGAQNLLARLNGIAPDRTVKLPCKLVTGATTRSQQNSV